MAKLLYIQASPRGKRSKSNTVADAFVETYKQANPQDTVEVLNLYEEDLPAFDGLAVQAKYSIMHGKEHSSEEVAAWKAIEEVIEQFKSADKYVLSVPMWNFSIPYRLKQYIDLQSKYIELIFGFIGFADIQTIVVEPTLQGGPDVTEQKVNSAIESARSVAESF